MATGKLTGQVAIVTGASSGIGKATAYALADEGMKVAIVARSADVINQMADEINGKGGTAIAYAADVADADAVDRFVANVVHEWGRIDLLFANAGVNTKQRNLHDMSVEQWDYVVDVNLNGVLYCVRAVLPQMRAQHRGDDHHAREHGGAAFGRDVRRRVWGEQSGRGLHLAQHQRRGEDQRHPRHRPAARRGRDGDPRSPPEPAERGSPRDDAPAGGCRGDGRLHRRAAAPRHD